MQIKIGNWERDYAVMTTNAPQAYDHGAVIRLWESSSLG